MAKLLIASLVDPATHPGGAGTYTRGLVAALRKGRSGHEVELIGPLHPPPGPWYRARQTLSLVQSCLSKLPAKVLFARRHEFRIGLREIVRSCHFDATLINGSDMLWAVDELPPGMPTVLIAHNLEHQLLTQQLAFSPFLSLVLRREIRKQQRYEVEGFARVGGVIFLSATDQAWGCIQIPKLRALHVPPLFVNPAIPRKRRPSSQLRLGLLADFAWWPNRQNWLWLIQDILPKVRRPLIVHILGRHSERVSAGDRIVAHGLIRDVSMVWNQVDIMICPIRVGAGVSIKLAESLYNHMPVLATTLAMRGLECSSGAGLIVKDSAEEWAMFLNSAAAEDFATQTPAEALRRQFSPDGHVEKLNHFLSELIQGRSRHDQDRHSDADSIR